MASRFIYIKSARARYAEMSDAELIEAYKSKRANAVIDELFSRYAHLVFPICRKYLKDESKAKDAVMEIFSALGDKLVKHSVRNFRAWLLTVTKNECLIQIRKTKREIVSDNVEFLNQFRVESAINEHLFDEEEGNEEKLGSFFAKLKNAQKQCLEMMYFQNMSYKEISSTTGLSMKEVKSHIQNGKRRLRIMFEASK